MFPTILGGKTYFLIWSEGREKVCIQKSTQKFATLIANINLPSMLKTPKYMRTKNTKYKN